MASITVVIGVQERQANRSMRTVLSEHQYHGLLIQQASYSWAANSALAECDPAVTLKYVPKMGPIHARASTDTKGEYRIGRLILTPAMRTVCARAIRDEHDMRALVFHFDPDWLNRLWRSDALRIDDVPIDLQVRSTYLEGTLARFADELRRPGVASSQMLRSLTQVLAIDLGRYIQDLQASREAAGGSLSSRRLMDIREFVVNYGLGTPKPRDVAAACSLSPGHLRRLFKQATGRTLRDYIEQIQIEKARALMQMQPNLPMKVISHRLGYRHASAFSAAFKRITGENPCVYRKSLLRKITPASPMRYGREPLAAAEQAAPAPLSLPYLHS